MTDPSAPALLTPLPGLYPNDPNVPVRPPPIPATIVMRSYGKKVGPSTSSQKDINRWVRAVVVVGEYVRDHNEEHQGNLQMQYRWYDSSLSDKAIQATLYRIVDDKAKEHIGSLYGRYTYNEAQIRHGREMEQFVAEVAKDPMFDPLTQTVRLFGVRSVIETKMTTKRRGLRQKEKRNALRDAQPDAWKSSSHGHNFQNGSSSGVTDRQRADVESSQKEMNQSEVPTTNSQSVFNQEAVSVVADLPDDVITPIVQPRMGGPETPDDSNERQLDKDDTAAESKQEKPKDINLHSAPHIASHSDGGIDEEDTDKTIAMLEKKLMKLKQKRKNQDDADADIEKGVKRTKKNARSSGGTASKSSTCNKPQVAENSQKLDRQDHEQVIRKAKKKSKSRNASLKRHRNRSTRT